MPRKKSAPVKRSLPSATGGDQPAASRKLFVVEEKGDYESASEIYKFLIKEYPNSLEAASSRIKVTDIKSPSVESPRK